MELHPGLKFITTTPPSVSEVQRKAAFRQAKKNEKNAKALLKSLSEMSALASKENPIPPQHNETIADAANVVALQAELANARAELDRQKTHDAKQVNNLKRAIDWTEEARDTMEKRLERSQLVMKQRERTWATTEARLEAGKEDAIVDAAQIRERLRLTQLDHEKHLAKAQEEKHNLDELLKKKSISLETIESTLQFKVKTKETKIESVEANQKIEEDELAKTQEDYKYRKSEVDQTKAILKEEHSNLRDEESQLKALADKLQSVKEHLAAKKSRKSAA